MVAGQQMDSLALRQVFILVQLTVARGGMGDGTTQMLTYVRWGLEKVCRDIHIQTTVFSQWQTQVNQVGGPQISSHTILVSKDSCVTKYHKPGGLKQQIFILSQYWRLDVQNQGVSRAMFPPKNPSLHHSSFWKLVAILGICWLVAASLESLPLSSQGLSLISLCLLPF